MLVMIYKVKNNMTPNYLTELLPDENQNEPNYNLRNKKNLRLSVPKKELVRRSFLHTAVRLWNNETISIRESTSLYQFKSQLKSKRKIANILYYYGERWLSAIHARLRIGCSKLNYDLSYNLHIPDINPSCLCGAKLETANHFLMHCKHYADQRQILKAKEEAIK